MHQKYYNNRVIRSRPYCKLVTPFSTPEGVKKLNSEVKRMSIVKKKKFLRLDEMIEGMRVQVYGRYTSDCQVGIVIKVDSDNNCRMIDGKPVKGSPKVREVHIAYERGGELKLLEANANAYEIVRL